MAAVRLRRLWLKLHRWVGLSLGMLLLISATTGTLLIVGEPIDEALRPDLHRAQQAGERVAVIEAMKMENVLFAAADGVVKKVVAAKGESLTVDQMIVEFE